MDFCIVWGGHRGFLGGSQWVCGDLGVPSGFFRDFRGPSHLLALLAAVPSLSLLTCGALRGEEQDGGGGIRNPLPRPPKAALPLKFQRFPSLEPLPPAGPGVLGVLRPAGTQRGGDIRAGFGPSSFLGCPNPSSPPHPLLGCPNPSPASLPLFGVSPPPLTSLMSPGSPFCPCEEE